MSSIIYLAARYSRAEELCGYAKVLRESGYEVTSRWLDGSSQISKEAKEVEASTDSIPLSGRLFAEIDYTDLLRSDTLIAFTEKPGAGPGRGGRHVEFGLAVAWGHRIMIVGPRENVFHTLPEVEQFWTWDAEVIQALGER